MKLFATYATSNISITNNVNVYDFFLIRFTICNYSSTTFELLKLVVIYIYYRQLLQLIDGYS